MIGQTRRVLSVHEFAREVDLSEECVRSLIRAKHVRAYMIGRAWAIPAEELKKYLDGDEEGEESSNG